MTDMEKIIIYYKEVDAYNEAIASLAILLIAAVIAIFIPFLWILVVVGVFFVVPFMYKHDKEQEANVEENVPALVIDDFLLEYKCKTIDLSQMDHAKIYSFDYSDYIRIYSKESRRPCMEISVNDMNVYINDLLAIINRRIEEGKQQTSLDDQLNNFIS